MENSWPEELHAGATACRNSIQRTFAHHIPLYVCAVLFCGMTAAIAHTYHVPLRLGAGSFFFEMVGEFAALALGALAAWEFAVLARDGFPNKPVSLIGQRLLRWFLAGDRSGNIFHTLIVLPVLTISFTALKDQIPQINPFSWDKAFMAMDRVIGFGHTPWEAMQPLLGYPPITAIINIVYNVWFLVLFGVLFWQAFGAKTNVTRLQFLLAYSFAWFVAGNVLAAIFSSAGPCFYGRLHIGPDPYAAQMAYLNYVSAHWPAWAYVMQDVSVQNLLWRMYVNHTGDLGGISAMPSMHVTTCAVMMLLAWKTNKHLGVAFTVFTAFIVVGSVRLGWHYAADAIAGIFLGAVFWIVAGRIALAWDRFLERNRSKPLPSMAPAVAAREA